MIENQSVETVYDLNLSETYVPNWGAWEIGREIVSNAIDADPAGYSIEVTDEHNIMISTDTFPTIHQIKVLGMGTKSPTSDTIGQFGEGLKLAALAACRMDGKCHILIPGKSVRFELRTVWENEPRILHMVVKETDVLDAGCQIYIGVEGIAKAIEGKFLKDIHPGPREKKSDVSMNVFLKGVFVQSIKIPHLYDWVVDHCEINRDRNIINEFYLKKRIAIWLNKNMSAEVALNLTQAPTGTFELDVLKVWPELFGERAKRFIVDEYKKKFGSEIVIATGDAIANKIAANTGKTVLVLDQGIVEVIKTEIPSSEKSVPKDAQFTQVQPLPEWKSMFQDFNRLSDLLEIPVEVLIFQDFDKVTLGKAILREDKKGCTVWLNEKLFLPGYRRNRLATFLHEVSHVRDQEQDGTLEFETSLTKVLGDLAVSWLDIQLK